MSSYATEPKHAEVVNWQLMLIWKQWRHEGGLFDAAVSQIKKSGGRWMGSFVKYISEMN